MLVSINDDQRRGPWAGGRKRHLLHLEIGYRPALKLLFLCLCGCIEFSDGNEADKFLGEF